MRPTGALSKLLKSSSEKEKEKEKEEGSGQAARTLRSEIIFMISKPITFLSEAEWFRVKCSILRACLLPLELR